MSTEPGNAATALKAKLDALVEDAEEAEEKAVAACRRARAARTLLEEEQTAAALEKAAVAAPLGFTAVRHPMCHLPWVPPPWSHLPWVPPPLEPALGGLLPPINVTLHLSIQASNSTAIPLL
jgi:hypothetical protein